MPEKIYIGTGKRVEFKTGGSMIKMAFSRDDLQKLNDGQDQGGWVRIDICERKAPSAKGQTHYGMLNTWKPTDRANDQQAEKPVEKLTVKPKEQEMGDLPF